MPILTWKDLKNCWIKNVTASWEGILRGVDFNGDHERTFCFGLPGTIFNSRFSFYKKLPSYYQIEACCPSVILRIPREDYIALTDSNHAFAVWALHYAWYEQYLEEDRERPPSSCAVSRRVSCAKKKTINSLRTIKKSHFGESIPNLLNYVNVLIFLFALTLRQD